MLAHVDDGRHKAPAAGRVGAVHLLTAVGCRVAAGGADAHGEVPAVVTAAAGHFPVGEIVLRGLPRGPGGIRLG